MWTCVHVFHMYMYIYTLIPCMYTQVYCMCARVEWWCAYYTHACIYISKILTCLSSGVLNLNVVIDIHMKWVKGYYRGGTPIPSLTHPLRQCHPLPHSITSLLAPDMYMYAMKYGRVPKRHTCIYIYMFIHVLCLTCTNARWLDHVNGIGCEWTKLINASIRDVLTGYIEPKSVTLYVMDTLIEHCTL